MRYHILVWKFWIEIMSRGRFNEPQRVTRWSLHCPFLTRNIYLYKKDTFDILVDCIELFPVSTNVRVMGLIRAGNEPSQLVSHGCKSAHIVWINLHVLSLLMNSTDVAVGSADVRRQVQNQSRSLLWDLCFSCIQSQTFNVRRTFQEIH